MPWLEPVVEPSRPVFADEDGLVGLDALEGGQVIEGVELEVGGHQDCKERLKRSQHRLVSVLKDCSIGHFQPFRSLTVVNVAPVHGEVGRVRGEEE